MPSVAGDNELMPVTDIVAWLAKRRPTATLSVRRRDVESRFLIREGACTQSWSTDPREYLGQHLINFGFINEDDLQRAFDTQKETRVPLGRVLVMVEALTQAQLQRVLTFKTREGLLEALCWNDGSWRVTPGVDGDPDLDCERAVDLREAYAEAMARRQMWGEIRRVFPSDATRCDMLDDGTAVLSAFDRRLLALMATGSTVGEAALELRAMDFQTYARLYDLANRKLLRARVTTMEISIDDLAQLDILQGFVVAAGPEAGAAGGVEGPRAFELAPPVTADATPVVPGSLAVLAPPPARPTPPASPTSSAPATPDASTATPPAATRSNGPTGSVTRLRLEQVVEKPGVAVPAEATDPLNALRAALAGRHWSEVVTLAQRILEHEPHNSEAVAALRAADGQLRRGREETSEHELLRAPRLAMPREQIAQAHLSSKERYVLSRVDGARTLGQIVAVSPISRTELVRIVDGFVARGVLSY